MVRSCSVRVPWRLLLFSVVVARPISITAFYYIHHGTANAMQCFVKFIVSELSIFWYQYFFIHDLVLSFLIGYYISWSCACGSSKQLAFVTAGDRWINMQQTNNKRNTFQLHLTNCTAK